MKRASRARLRPWLGAEGLSSGNKQTTKRGQVKRVRGYFRSPSQGGVAAAQELRKGVHYRHDAENDLAAAEASNRAIRHGLAVALRGVAIALEQ